MPDPQSAPPPHSSQPAAAEPGRDGAATQREALPPISADSAISAQRIRFLPNSPAGAIALQSFVNPYPRVAIGQAVSPRDMLASNPSGAATDDELHVLFLPAGSSTPLEWQRRAEVWMNEPVAATSLPTIDLMLRSERILWRPGRAAVFGSPERFAEILPGLIDFSFHEAELRKLEQELHGEWATAEADVVLTHSVGGAQLAQRAHVDDMTRRTTLRRIRFVRLEPHLEKASVRLPGPARRLAAELGLQAEVVDRLKYVDDRLEVYEDLYELANDRLSEFSYFHREYWLEIWIIVLLVAEVLVMGADLIAYLRDAGQG